jgi:hypothetical protein
VRICVLHASTVEKHGGCRERAQRVGAAQKEEKKKTATNAATATQWSGEVEQVLLISSRRVCL